MGGTECKIDARRRSVFVAVRPSKVYVICTSASLPISLADARIRLLC